MQDICPGLLGTEGLSRHQMGGLKGSPWGGGGRLQCKMPGCVCLGSENVPIMKDALG